ncbi:hypothetical protein BCEN4_180006 [Burkholderia cenocepacia]|nr:hypothetical protein BCEN4_180006 [Burkholderia cenocepacia]
MASDNTMFLHLHTSVIGMLREHISIDVTDDEGGRAGIRVAVIAAHGACTRRFARTGPKRRAPRCRRISAACAAISNGSGAS